MAPLNSTMLAVALPEIREGLSVGHAEVGWLITAYLIAMAVAQPVGGRLADQIGRGLTFRLGLVVFLAFSLAAIASPNLYVLIALRTGQALSGAVVIPSAMAMLRSEVGSGRLGEAVGLLGAIIGISAAVGPLIAGGILEIGSWRPLFLVNLPLVVLALASQLVLDLQEAGRSVRPSLDLVGAGLLALILVLISFLLSSATAQSPILIASLTLVLAVFLAGFVRSQVISNVLVAEWSLFRRRNFVGATAFVLLSNMVMYTTLLSVPFFVQEVQGRGAAETGLLLGCMSILMALLAPLAGRLSDQRGRRLPALLAGTAQVTAAIVLLVGISESSPFIFIAASLSLMGLGVGLGSGPAMTAAIESAPVEGAGAASGTVSMTRYLGSITGAGILGSILTEGDPSGAEVFRVLWGVMAVIALLAASQIHSFRHSTASELAESGVVRA